LAWRRVTDGDVLLFLFVLMITRLGRDESTRLIADPSGCTSQRRSRVILSRRHDLALPARRLVNFEQFRIGRLKKTGPPPEVRAK